MANGSEMPRSASAPTTGRDTPRSAKDCDDIGMTPCGASGPRLIREAIANPNRPCGGTQASCLAADDADRSPQHIGIGGVVLEPVVHVPSAWVTKLSHRP